MCQGFSRVSGFLARTGLSYWFYLSHKSIISNTFEGEIIPNSTHMNENCVCYQIFWSIQASCSFEKLLQFFSWSPSCWYSRWSVFEKSIKSIPFMLISAVIFLLIYLWVGTKGKPDHLHSLRQTSPQSEQRILPYFQKYNHLGAMFYVHSTSSWLFSGRDGDGISSTSCTAERWISGAILLKELCSLRPKQKICLFPFTSLKK